MPYCRNRTKEYNDDEFINTFGERRDICTRSDKEAREQLSQELEKKSIQHEALKDMFTWLEDKNSSLYALLGDYGMGKTFTCRIYLP